MSRKNESELNPKEILKSIIELKESIKELRESQKETDKLFKETGDQIRELRESIRELRESQKKTDEQIKETDEYLRKKIENLGREIAKLRDSQSEFMEGIVLPSAQKFIESLGLKITDSLQNYELKDERGQTIAEYDAIFFSGTKLFVVEVKSSAGSKDVDRFIENVRKLERSKLKFSEVYGILASARFKNGTEKYALRKGLAVLMPSGEILAPQKKNFRPIIKKR